MPRGYRNKPPAGSPDSHLAHRRSEACPSSKERLVFGRSWCLGLLESNPYRDSGHLNFINSDVLYKQVRNLVFNTTDIPGQMLALHWLSSRDVSIWELKEVVR